MATSRSTTFRTDTNDFLALRSGPQRLLVPLRVTP
jgi:hypothetical protein